MMQRLYVILVVAFFAVPAPAMADFATFAEMIEVRAAATDADRASAKAFLKGAEDATQRGKWSGAAKGYGEALLFWPSGAALLGKATALAHISRDADGCENGYRIKLSDLSRALRSLVFLQQLGEVDGQVYDAQSARGAIAEAQRTVFEQLDACATD